MSARGGVGKTSLIYHLAHMLPRLGYPTLAVDLDPQATLSSMFFDDAQLRAAWDRDTGTVFSCIAPLFSEEGQVHPPEPQPIEDSLWGLMGSPSLWELEAPLANAWMECHARSPFALGVLSAFAQVLKQAGESTKSAVALIDLGAGPGALNRAALLASDCLVFPLVVDTFAVPGLKVIGSAVRQWREEWKQLRALNQEAPVELPEGHMSPVGYTVLRTDARRGARFVSHAADAAEVPFSYAVNVLGTASFDPIEDDPNCLSVLRNYASLMSMAREARAPMFDLTPSTGALGSYAQLVRYCHDEYELLARRLVDRCGLVKPSA